MLQAQPHINFHFPPSSHSSPFSPYFLHRPTTLQPTSSPDLSHGLLESTNPPLPLSQPSPTTDPSKSRRRCPPFLPPPTTLRLSKSPPKFFSSEPSLSSSFSPSVAVQSELKNWKFVGKNGGHRQRDFDGSVVGDGCDNGRGGFIDSSKPWLGSGDEVGWRVVGLWRK
ncbi:hypothetical protein Acr_05g0010540 [Actinidia rufa]|uniref:Uncharacterized protein n=1 Tax=Actinidia rufa TaxID=165716 RepID=A0A7J0ELR3_9ERIC|nr:hypothetical protein Acr_05g0010540 [Actinidia rufa]